MNLLTRIAKSAGKNVRDAMLIAGVGPTMKEDNRRVLETVIFPHLRDDSSIQSILFVGCHWYTWHYRKLLLNKQFSTIEINPERARYGAKHHIIDSIENVGSHFDGGSLDVIMMLGVIGWGLDDPRLVENSLAACHDCLRNGGLLVLGNDEVPEHTPVDLVQSPTLKSMSTFAFPPFKSSRYRCEGSLNHTFSFYRKTEHRAGRRASSIRNTETVN